MKTIKLLLLLIIVGLLYLIIKPEHYTNYISIPNRSLPSPIKITTGNCKEVCNKDANCNAYINDNGQCSYTTTLIHKKNLIFNKNENPLYVKICDPITHTLPPPQPPLQPPSPSQPPLPDIDCSALNAYKLSDCPILSELCSK